MALLIAELALGADLLESVEFGILAASIVSATGDYSPSRGWKAIGGFDDPSAAAR
jgi:hypothetical protein